jgi:hypothetical protein
LATALAGLSACNLRHARASGCAFYFSNPKKSKKISMLWNFFYQPQYIVVYREHNPGQLFSFFLKNSVWRGRFLSKKSAGILQTAAQRAPKPKIRPGIA